MASSSSMSSSSCPFFFCLSLLLFMAMQVDSRPSQQKSESQILNNLFGARISSLLLTQPEVIEGSAENPPSGSQGGHNLSPRMDLARSKVPAHGLPRFFLDFMGRQRKFRGRTRKSSGRGCFGLKMDRIGALSGLGC
ncbi:hypothetical protein JZ751_006722 [Albula glossodonta]|uniref:C-type natriuretic peptide n=1 Tax=Albula glossodonta TaxID=121402 RepID=A0A8T2P553_9TELE|nr:hypothetical protein JZ751_006722 [Albula glossodonta]